MRDLLQLFCSIYILFILVVVVMNINSAIDTGLQGIRQASEGLEKSATEVVRAGTVSGADGSNDIVEPLIELKLYERAVSASAQVVRTADETLGTLLDTMA